MCLVQIMHWLARTGHIAPLIQCSRRYMLVAKKYGFYGCMITGGVAANRIARAYRFFCKYSSHTHTDFDSAFASLAVAAPRQLSIDPADAVCRFDRSRWQNLCHVWLNSQPHSILPIFASNQEQRLVIPRHFDILRTITIAGDRIESVSLCFHSTTVQCTLPKTNFMVWEVNIPSLALPIFWSLVLHIKLLDGIAVPAAPQIQLRGAFLQSTDRHRLQQSNAGIDYFAATKNAIIIIN